uniref:Cytochrome c1-2, heme protein, mitochondrial n=1 Tax=Solanum tuberosum TaxID=4113 RepID=M1BEX4_SOLTU
MRRIGSASISKPCSCFICIRLRAEGNDHSASHAPSPSTTSISAAMALVYATPTRSRYEIRDNIEWQAKRCKLVGKPGDLDNIVASSLKPSVKYSV